MASNIPNYLYHYTSINVLALILKNKTIRFRRLDLMDDPYEAMTADLGRQGKYVMVSSWSAKEEEDLLTWSLYTNNLRGVRIRLPSLPFTKRYTIKQEDIPIPLKPEKDFDSYIEAKHIYNDRYSIPGIDFENSIKKVCYTDDEKKLYPKVVTRSENGGIGIILSELGTYKKSIWEGQQEWRYLFPIFPMTREILRTQKEGDYDRYGKLIYEAMRYEQEPGIEHIDIPITPDCFNHIEITHGPRNENSDRIIVSSLVEKYASNAIIRESNLVNFIK